jgi:AmpD protein
MRCIQDAQETHGEWIHPRGGLVAAGEEGTVAQTPDLLVIHNISLPPGCYGGDAIERFFTNCLDCDEHPFYREISGLEVSAHLLIRRPGEMIQFVFDGRDNCNDFSIGIELEGTDEDPYTDQQYRVLAGVTATLQAHYPAIGSDRIVGHCDIAPGRKTDPGPAFDWGRFRGILAALGDEA